jgi:hypothetical protein
MRRTAAVLVAVGSLVGAEGCGLGDVFDNELTISRSNVAHYADQETTAAHEAYDMLVVTVRQVGQPCVDALIDTSQADIANDDARDEDPTLNDSMDDASAAATVADACPTRMDHDDRKALVDKMRHDIVPPLLTLITDGAYEDRQISEAEWSDYEEQVLDDEVAFWEGDGYTITED